MCRGRHKAVLPTAKQIGFHLDRQQFLQSRSHRKAIIAANARLRQIVQEIKEDKDDRYWRSFL